MNVFVIIIITAVIAYSLSIVYVFFHNNHILDKRIEMLNHDYESYLKLPSFRYMTKRFWIWDIKKFIKED